MKVPSFHHASVALIVSVALSGLGCSGGQPPAPPPSREPPAGPSAEAKHVEPPAPASSGGFGKDTATPWGKDVTPPEATPPRTDAKAVHGKARIGKITVAGGPAAPILKLIEDGRPKVLACYESGLATNPKLEGRVGPKLAVDDKGDTVVVEVGESELGKRGPVIDCIVEALRTLPYPKAAKGKLVVFVVPFVFSPDDVAK